MRPRDDWGARDTLPGGPGRNRQYNGGTASISPMVDAINHSGGRRILCCGCGGAATESETGKDWRVALMWADFGTIAGVYRAALCPACHPRINEREFRRRFNRTVAAKARDEIEGELIGGGQ